MLTPPYYKNSLAFAMSCAKELKMGNAHHSPLGQIQLYIITIPANILHRYAWKTLRVD